MPNTKDIYKLIYNLESIILLYYNFNYVTYHNPKD